MLAQTPALLVCSAHRERDGAKQAVAGLRMATCGTESPVAPSALGGMQLAAWQTCISWQPHGRAQASVQEQAPQAVGRQLVQAGWSPA